MRATARALLPPAAAGLQVNVCKRPECASFGVQPNPEAELAPAPYLGVGPNGFYDGHYAIRPASSTGGKPTLECLDCHGVSPLKSNRAIATEQARRAPAEAGPAGCPKPDCTNAHAAPVRSPERYTRYGTNRGGATRLRCRACGGVFTPGRARPGPARQPWLHEEYIALERVLQHTPIRRILQGAGLNAGRFYPLLSYAAQAVNKWMGAADQQAAGAAGDLSLALCVDRQVYAVNWSDRGDRRKVMLHAIATADQRTGFVFVMDANYDPAVDPDALTDEARANGDAAKPPCYRAGDAARCWLAEERNRRMEGGADIGATAPGAAPERRYRRAAARADVEAPEVAGRAPAQGALVREDVSVYAHFQRVRQLLGDPVSVQLYFEQESSMRAAALTAWGERIKAGACEAYYVRIAKDQTARAKQAIGAATEERLAAVQAAHGCTRAEATRHLVRAALVEQPMRVRGPWQDRWLAHPCPSAFEPAKEVARLTRRDPAEDEAQNLAVVNGYAFAGLGAVDRFFLGVRYALNLLDRGRVSGQRHGRLRGRGLETSADDKWDVYHPYNPAQVQALLDLQRLWWN